MTGAEVGAVWDIYVTARGRWEPATITSITDGVAKLKYWSPEAVGQSCVTELINLRLLPQTFRPHQPG